MVIEKMVPDLLSQLESRAGDVTPEIPMVSRPHTPIASPSPQNEPVDKKREKGPKSRKGGRWKGGDPRRDSSKANLGFKGHSSTTEEGRGGCRDCPWTLISGSCLESFLGQIFQLYMQSLRYSPHGVKTWPYQDCCIGRVSLYHNEVYIHHLFSRLDR